MDTLNKLKKKRQEIAEREGKQLFMVFHNSTLEETVAARPKNVDELKEIKGWGQKRIKKYGREIINLINSEPEKNSPTTSAKINPQEIIGEKIFEVGEFIEFVSGILGGLGEIKVKGEISEIDYRNGNCYATLKDSSGNDSSVRCLIWRWDVEYVSHFLEVGLEVVVSGVPNLYKKGNFSLIVKSVNPVGAGAIKKALEALKKKLEAKGYFDLSRKKSLPRFVKKIGLVTSESGEAINDFLKNVGHRGFNINFFDVFVEGSQAENSVVRALKWLNLNLSDLDVIVLIRGGGSAESLQAFNSEKIAEAVFMSRIPVITGVGHEGDETIVDFVSDERCSTPTAVALLINRLMDNLEKELAEKSFDLSLSFEKNLEIKNRKIQKNGFSLFTVLQKVFERWFRVESSFSRAAVFIEKKIQIQTIKLKNINQNFVRAAAEKINEDSHSLSKNELSLTPLNPQAVLGRGYSLVKGPQGFIVKDSASLKTGDTITAVFHSGSVVSSVEKILN